MRKCSFRKGAWSFGGPQEENVDIYGQELWVDELSRVKRRAVRRNG